MGKIITPMLIILTFILFGCQKTPTRVFPDAFQACSNIRPEVCTFQYLPVCAVKKVPKNCTDNCTLEYQTKSNACVACSDPAIAGHIPNACTTES